MKRQVSPALLSLVVPVLNEEEVIPLFLDEVAKVLAGIGMAHEIVFVDDGSTDSTAKVVAAAAKKDKRVKLVRLSRNFGKEAALCAGLAHAKGDAVVPMDVDLQDPPEVLVKMVSKWQKGAKVVCAVRDDRKSDGWFKRFTSGWFYRVFNWLSGVPLVENAGDYRLLDKQVVQALMALPERTRFLKGLYGWVGFPTEEVRFVRPKRAAGVTRWNYWKLWNYGLEGLFSFSTLPLRIWTYFGGALALAGFALAAWHIVRVLLWGVVVPGYASLLVVILVLGGVQLVGLGLVGEYIARIFQEVKQRPLYVVSEKVGVDD
jgi:glycosyltransferase involved in cell wall biosynthesis